MKIENVLFEQLLQSIWGALPTHLEGIYLSSNGQSDPAGTWKNPF